MAIDYARKRSKEQDHTVLYEDYNKLSKTIDPVGEEVVREEQEKTISTLLEALSPNLKVCIVLRSIEGLSYQEIAESLSININTVRSRLKRAREKLIALRKEMVKNEM
jgi:RNA polymerase sigma-70 factor (ECF subfamily)